MKEIEISRTEKNEITASFEYKGKRAQVILDYNEFKAITRISGNEKLIIIADLENIDPSRIQISIMKACREQLKNHNRENLSKKVTIRINSKGNIVAHYSTSSGVNTYYLESNGRKLNPLIKNELNTHPLIVYADIHDTAAGDCVVSDIMFAVDDQILPGLSAINSLNSSLNRPGIQSTDNNLSSQASSALPTIIQIDNGPLVREGAALLVDKQTLAAISTINFQQKGENRTSMNL